MEGRDSALRRDLRGGCGRRGGAGVVPERSAVQRTPPHGWPRDGLQRAWRENGELYANYEARDGRIYGLKRANPCFDLEEERIVEGAEPDPSMMEAP